MNSKKIITSEYVSFGHPDKIADQIADAIVDEFVKGDKNSRTGIEVMVKDNIVVLGGEVYSSVRVDYDRVVREVFDTLKFPEHNHSCLLPGQIKIINLIGKQSPEIHSGVDKSDGEIGAGDQGMMFGFASNETSCYLPLGYYLAKVICQHVCEQGCWGPDTKTQVSVEYDGAGKPAIPYILVSTMHQDSLEEVRKGVTGAILNNEVLMGEVFDKHIKNSNVRIDVNPCGEWRVGGSISDAGVTGRKIVVDQFGGYCNVGGGAFSGKDLSKVDRSAAYMARYLAKNIVASGICNTCKIELSYQIGIAQPSSFNIELDVNQHHVDDIKKYINENISLTPKAIIDRFGIFPRNYQTARYGHYGMIVENEKQGGEFYPWEKLDFVNNLRYKLFGNELKNDN
jgi:S-adenosylmethionine synthetase